MPNCIGWLHRELQDFEGALKYDREGLRVGREFHVLEAEANSLINLGIDHTVARKPDEAAAVFHETNDIFDRDKWFKWRYNIRLEAATAEHWLRQGKLREAREFTSKLFASANEFKCRKYMAVAHRLRASIAITEKNVETAHEEFRAALKLLEEYPAPLVKWRILADLGRLLTDTRDTDEARDAFAGARDIVNHIAANVSDEALRSMFLNSSAVQEVMNTAT